MDIDDDDDEFILCELAAEFGSGDDAAPAADLLTQRGVNVPEELNEPDWNEYWHLRRIALAECLAELNPPRGLREGQRRRVRPPWPGRGARTTATCLWLFSGTSSSAGCTSAFRRAWSCGWSPPPRDPGSPT